MNLAILRKSNRRPQVGDIFVMAPLDGRYVYGRVMSTDADPMGVGGGILIYIYRAWSAEKAKIPNLLREQLLVPPIMTNTLPWTKGYFEFVENRPLTPMDRLRQHSFVRTWANANQYFDEQGNRLPGPIEPVGQWGLHSYQTIDQEVATALGLSTVKEDVPRAQ
jgi:hypothetical protein